MKNKDNRLEELIKQSLEKQDKESPERGGQCLSDELIRDLYDGTLDDVLRHNALEHLDQCQQCRVDLAFYAELMNPQVSPATAAKLHGIKHLLPRLAEKLTAGDFISLGKKLSRLCEKLIDGSAIEATDAIVGEILDRLEAKFPALAVPVRGEAQSGEGLSPEALRQIGQDICDETKRLMKQVVVQEVETKWAGLPELWILEQLSGDMKRRAVHLRDWCEVKLELMGSREQMRYLPSLGVGHSKRMLGFAVDFFRAFEAHFSDPLSCAAIYAGSYCFNLGMILGKDERELSDIYQSHGRQTWDYIVGNASLEVLPSWIMMGISSEQNAVMLADVCAGKQKDLKGHWVELAGTQSMFLDGEMMNVSPLAVAAILKLANRLDCHPTRLPPPELLKQVVIPDVLVNEYLKNELVRQVKIDETGAIHIKMGMNYIYPKCYGDVQEAVRTELERDIGEARAVLKQCGIIMPEPTFDFGKSLFLEEHPYLGQDEKD